MKWTCARFFFSKRVVTRSLLYHSVLLRLSRPPTPSHTTLSFFFFHSFFQCYVSVAISSQSVIIFYHYLYILNPSNLHLKPSHTVNVNKTECNEKIILYRAEIFFQTPTKIIFNSLSVIISRK